jgi:predicted DNA-binding protein (MmcQ/YjbR family)
MLNARSLMDYCLAKKGAVETFPFGPDARVFKVMAKMFAIMPADGTATISLKCDPTWAKLLRDTYEAVQPGYHLNKVHWNTVRVDGTIPDAEIREMIDHSYQLVVKGLKKTEREVLAKLYP